MTILAATESLQFYGLVFEKKVSIGNLLTIGTVLVGIASWLIAKYRESRAEKFRTAQNGALRLLLRYLRRLETESIKDEELRKLFNSEDKEALNLRETYCKYNFILEPGEFEKALYQLDWEGKIDFPERDRVAFRLDRRLSSTRRFKATDADAEVIFNTLEDLIDENAEEWVISRVASGAMRIDPERAAKIIRQALHSSTQEKRRKISQIMDSLIAD